MQKLTHFTVYKIFDNKIPVEATWGIAPITSWPWLPPWSQRLWWKWKSM